MMQIFRHYREVDVGTWRWKNFPPDEPYLACPCCGELCLHGASMDLLQRARNMLRRPIRLNSGHRCGIHNARVGGAPKSQHKIIAFDISLAGHDRRELFGVLCRAGFTTFGFYRTFIHVDIRPGRQWFGPMTKEDRDKWTSVICST